MRVDREKVRANVEQATTEDLLDRATVYRGGMEREALDLIDAELWRRGVTQEEIGDHEQRRRQTMLTDPDGMPVKCQKCFRPAVTECLAWHWLWGVLPLFPRRAAFCPEHKPRLERPAATP
jgi:hypothetical protein